MKKEKLADGKKPFDKRAAFGKKESGKKADNRKNDAREENKGKESGKTTFGRKEKGEKESGKPDLEKEEKSRKEPGQASYRKKDNKGKESGKPVSVRKKENNGSESGKPASARKRSRCPASSLCGGCSMIDVPYDEQIRGKMEVLEDLIGEYVVPDPFIRMKAPEHYRHKVTSVFAPDRKGRPVCGIYREGTHEVVPVKSCLIEHIQADRIIQTIYSMLPSFRIHVYDEDMDMGLLRYVQVRAARVTKEIMVTLVLTDPVLPSRNTFVRELTKKHPEITTIVLNVNDRSTTMVLGNRETVIYGKGFIEDVVCGKRFRISSRSFCQVNPLMTEKLYNIAIDCAALSGKETVLDTYCGIGTIGIIAAPFARRVVGVELSADAVRDAQQNIRMNGLDNIEILQGDATQFMKEMARALRASQSGTEAENPAEKKNPAEEMSQSGTDIGNPADRGNSATETVESPRQGEDAFTMPGEMFASITTPARVDVIFMDPPRSGATEDFMLAACAMQPKKIVYISCSPWSLQRDLAFFAENGYTAKKAVPVDMFPYTGGIETVVLLSNTGR